jgi:hypothetical protein
MDDVTAPRLAQFHNRHRGEACVLVCNGPSLNAMDLGFLKDRTVIGLNKIHLGLKRFGFQPQYLVAVNKRVVEQAGPQIAALPAIKFIGARAAAHLAEAEDVFHVPILDPPVVFSEDICRGVREGGTVTHAALQIAYYMGFAEVAIIGMDHRFTFVGDPHAPNLLKGPDPNHFSPDYFSGQIWDNPDLARSEQSYAVAREVYAASGRRIVDATLSGHCMVFDKVDYRVYFGLYSERETRLQMAIERMQARTAAAREAAAQDAVQAKSLVERLGSLKAAEVRLARLAE